MAISEITVSDLKARFARGDRFILLDVREPEEFELCHIPGARLLPLSELSSRMGELDRTDEIILQCRSGKRSAKALGLLRQAGFVRLWNLKGGITAWLNEVG